MSIAITEDIGTAEARSGSLERMVRATSKTCCRCEKEKYLDEFAPNRNTCKACQNAARNKRRQNNGFREYMRKYMDQYRKADPEREMLTIIKAVERTGGLFSRHPGVLQLEQIHDLISHELRPDQVVMLREEITIIYKAVVSSPNDQAEARLPDSAASATKKGIEQ